MNSVKIKTKESFSSFGSFPNDYPIELTGNISKNEFEDLIFRLNSSCKSSFNKAYLFFLLGPIAGVALIIAGIVRWRKLVEEEFDRNTKGHNYFESGDTDIFGFNQESFKPNQPLFYFVIGIALFLIGSIITCSAYLLFKSKVLGKLKEELVPINQMYSDRMISFKMEDETEKSYVPDHEFRVSKNNQAYMMDIKYDQNGNPYKEIEVHYLYITFPITPVRTIPTQPQMYSTTPNGYYTNSSIPPQNSPQNQIIEMNNI
ncbi:hypothetical protein RB653_005368 [Dictyostelium firmibasis]|uniref:Transmembrane protein n=1 Tax=Dictyostelium firmibasis TaxID=79012 RepID=A0AAN7UBD4_9MYCE